MKILHLADLHYRASRYNDIKIAHEDSLKIARDEKVDLIAIAGDIWDGTMQNTEGAKFSVFNNMLNEYADIAPVVLIYGTPTHDVSGSLEILQTQKNKYGIKILSAGTPYFLTDAQNIIPYSETISRHRKSKLLLLGVPEPSKKGIIRNIESKGKTATEAAVRKEMSGFFLGLAAWRKKYEHLPCVLLYHGQVSGSKMQNGQSIDRGSGIAITYDDLAVVGADYYALGDIHEPQRIGDLHAYYPGSFYNTNFGETHIPGCNLIEIIDKPTENLFVEQSRDVTVSRKLFNLPKQVKFQVNFNEVDNLDLSVFKSKRIWIVIKCTKDQALLFDTKSMEKSLITAGADKLSKVSLDIIPTETVRAAEITDKKKLRDKVLIWGEASGKEIPESLLDKADELELSEEGKETGYESVAIQIDKLILRGAIGIWKGLKVDEITVDFERMAPGIIALIGNNGQGKTTLIENLHPWPQMLTRSKKLQDQFRLKDSFRDLYFTDLNSGRKYRALLEIDGKNKSGSTDCYLFVNTGNGYEPVEGIDGRQKAYVQAIEKIFGSLSLYQKTAFITQKPTSTSPDISSATVKQKKEMLRELAGLGYLEEYALKAKENAVILENEVLRDSGKIEAFSGISDEIQLKTARKEEISSKLFEISAKNTELTENVLHLEDKLSDLLGKAEQNKMLTVKAESVTSSIDEIRETIKKNLENINTARIALKYKDDALKLKEKVEGLRARKQDLLSLKNKCDAKNNKIKGVWLEKCSIVDKNKNEILSLLNKLKNEKREIEQRIDKVSFQMSSLEKETNVKPSTSCPKCGQELPEATRLEILRDWEEKIEEIKILRRAKGEIIENELSKIETEIEEEQNKLNLLAYPEEPQWIPFDSSDLDDVQASLAFSEQRYDNACSTIKKAEMAESEITISESRIKEAEIRVTELEKERESILAQIGAKIDTEVYELKNTLSEAKQAMSETTEEKISLETTLKEVGNQLENLFTRKKMLEDLKAEVNRKKTKASEWRMLKDICGVNGIQALELDAIAPNIASIANKILKSAYGSKFQIEFRTTRKSGTGSKIKEIEDFSILIMDVEMGTVQDLEDLSGGESVWIKKAIYDAFSVIRARTSGKSFLTAFMDEADGALDPEMKEKYFLMSDAAHNESHRRHTIIISHSREIQEMAQQKIIMSDLKARAAKAA